MKEGNKSRLQIEKLKSHSDYCKWEIGQVNALYLGIIALLIAIFIPTMIQLDTWWITLILGSSLIIILVLFNKFIKPLTKRNEQKIKKYSKKINEIYKELLK